MTERGECPVCGKDDVSIKRDGTLYVHRARDLEDKPICDGSSGPRVEPFARPPQASTGEMTPEAAQLAARVKEAFFAYVHRRSEDNRGAQAKLGPSEVGTECDRQLAMKMGGFAPVNPGGDNWASFVGTWVHEGLARVFAHGSGKSGRWVVESEVTYGIDEMPRGRCDLIDRTLCLVADHKVMGDNSLARLASKGPPERYRVQLHLYAYGARRAGEDVDQVALIAWPRMGSSLDELFVWMEPYDPALPVAVMDRLGRIRTQVDEATERKLSADQFMDQFATADDCSYCPFHAPSGSAGGPGCPGA